MVRANHIASLASRLARASCSSFRLFLSHVSLLTPSFLTHDVRLRASTALLEFLPRRRLRLSIAAL